jgi:UDP-glucose 4-epimerase
MPAAATVAAVEADVAPVSVFNVAWRVTGHHQQRAAPVSDHVGRPSITRHLPAQAGDVQATHGSTDRTRRVLGWQPEVSLDDGVKLQVVHQLGGR